MTSRAEGRPAVLENPESTSGKPLVWITGCGGLIGSHLLRTAPSSVRVCGWTRAQLDLTDFRAVERAFQAFPPALIIHCAALSRSPDCQADPLLARLLNVEVTRFLAGLAARQRLIFFSSDLVFDGRQGNYAEADPPGPLSVYAETKVAAEQAVLLHRNHVVIRTSLNGGASPTGDRAFNEELRKAWESGRTVRLFTDEFRCPIPAEVTARATWELALSNAAGVFHVAGTERLSRWQIGDLIARRWPGLLPKLERSSLREYKGAPRAPDTSLNCAKVQSLLSFTLPGLGAWLDENPAETF